MACTITQADLGPLFADADPDLVAAFIEQATAIVLGPVESQAAKEAAMKRCGVDPCNMIKLLAQHLLSVTPAAGAGTQTVASQSVGGVSVTFAHAASNSGLFAGSPYGTLFAYDLAQFEKCSKRRRTFPMGVGPGGV